MAPNTRLLSDRHSLSYNDESVVALSDALKINATLRHSLSYNDESVVALSDALKINATLTELKRRGGRRAGRRDSTSQQVAVGQASRLARLRRRRHAVSLAGCSGCWRC